VDAQRVLVLFGVISYERIGMDRYPVHRIPGHLDQHDAQGRQPGHRRRLDHQHHRKLGQFVPGIEHIQSTSSPGVSVINITFNLEKKIDVAFNEVQAKVNQVLRRLPKDVDPPVVAKVETNAQPIMWLALQGDRTQQQLNQYAINVLKKRLETIDGVGEVRLGGRRDRTIRVNLLPAAWRPSASPPRTSTTPSPRSTCSWPAASSSAEDRKPGQARPGIPFDRRPQADGDRLEGRRHRSACRTSPKSIDGLTDNRQLARFNGETTIGLGIVKVTNTNTVAIVDKVKDKLENELRPQLPPGLQLHVVSNDAVFILEIVNSLKEHLLEGTLLAALVVWLFLRSVRSTLIIALAIPVSLMGAIAVIYFFGYTLNSLTLLACCCSSASSSTTPSSCSRTSSATAKNSTPTRSRPRSTAPTRSFSPSSPRPCRWSPSSPRSSS
jgi:HAE1 family hydrophobic/amphiphilic exporter-1